MNTNNVPFGERVWRFMTRFFLVLCGIPLLFALVAGAKWVNNKANVAGAQPQQQQVAVYPNQQQNQGNVAVASQQTHETWSAYGNQLFFVTDGTTTEAAGDIFTDPGKGALTLTIRPTEETCLLQYGTTTIFTDVFTATFQQGDTASGFRVISRSHWEILPSSDGAYQLCWPRQ